MLDLIQDYTHRFPELAPKVVTGIVVLLIFWIVAIITEKITLFLGKKTSLPKDILLLFGRIARMGLIIMGLISALGTMGVNVSALVASLGLTGFALGFALKDALSNVLSGALILIYRPFESGDRILIMGFEGDITKIDLRYTTLKTADKIILIPNSSLFNNPVVILYKNPS